MLIYCALNAAFVLLGLALCGSGFFGSGSFGVRALAWLLSLEAGFLGAFGAVYFSFRAYRNKIEDELRAGKYDEILRQSPKNSAGFMNDETSANDTNSASCGGENRGGTGGGDKISYSEVYGSEILKNENFSSLNLGAEISNARNSKGAVNFTSGDSCVENDDSHALHDETAAECVANSAANINFTHDLNLDAECGKTATSEHDVNYTKSDDETSACDAIALERVAADKFEMTCDVICGNSHGGISDKASDSSQGGIGARCDDLKIGASSDLGDGWSYGADRSNHSDGADSGEPGGGAGDFGGGPDGAGDNSKDDFCGAGDKVRGNLDGVSRNISGRESKIFNDDAKSDFDGSDVSANDWEGELEQSEVRSNFAGAFFSPFKILSYAALVAAIYLLAKLSLLNPLAIILGVTIIPLGTMIVAFADKDAR